MIDVPMDDAILCFDGDVLEVFSRFDKDSARILALRALTSWVTVSTAL